MITSRMVVMKVQPLMFIMTVLSLQFSTFTEAIREKRGLEQQAVLTEQEWRLNAADGFVFFEILQPEELAFTYKLQPAAFSNSWNLSTSQLRLVPTDPECGCGHLRNHDLIEGHVALMVRGECSFLSKVIRAEEAGAVMALVTDSDIENDALHLEMADDLTERSTQIPAAFILGAHGHVIRRTLERLSLEWALINIPFNASTVAMHKLNQPPWVVW